MGEIAEMSGEGSQESPRYPAGLALRFARVKGYRPDKPPEQADTIDTVRALFDQQVAYRARLDLPAD